MLGIGGFFDKIRQVYAKEFLIRSLIQDAIRIQTGVEVPVKGISFKNTVIVLDGVSQAAKSAIFIKKPAILKTIQEKQDLRNISDIR